MQVSFCYDLAQVAPELHIANECGQPFRFVYVDFKASGQRVLNMIDAVKLERDVCTAISNSSSPRFTAPLLRRAP